MFGTSCGKTCGVAILFSKKVFTSLVEGIDKWLKSGGFVDVGKLKFFLICASDVYVGCIIELIPISRL